MDGWSLPKRLAEDALDRLGVQPPVDRAGVDDLVEALGRQMPRGSTAKLAAITAGRRPSGWDPAEVVEGWLEDHHVAWTCWAAATVTAALVRAGGAVEAEVRGVRRRGETAPPVDFHSVISIVDRGQQWVCDPHFGVSTVPAGGGTRVRSLLTGTLAPRPDGRYDWTVAGPMFSVPELLYRSLTGPLDSDDVRAFCDVSMTHSGVRMLPFALLLLPDGYGTLRAESWTDPAELRLWRFAPTEVSTVDPQAIEPEQRELSGWAEGMDALHEAAAAFL